MISQQYLKHLHALIKWKNIGMKIVFVSVYGVYRYAVSVTVAAAGTF